MLTAVEYIKNRKNYSEGEIRILKKHAENFLFFKYEELRIYSACWLKNCISCIVRYCMVRTKAEILKEDKRIKHIGDVPTKGLEILQNPELLELLHKEWDKHILENAYQEKLYLLSH